MGARKLEYYQKKGALERPPNFDFEVLESSKPRKKEVGRTYQYGFNGMERVDEMKGSGNSYDFGARIYNPRLGKWMSVDPLQSKYPFASPYNFALNTPIQAVDPDGRLVVFVNGFRKSAYESYLKMKNPWFIYKAIPSWETGPIYSTEDVYGAKGGSYWRKADDLFMQRHRDYNSVYFDGGYTPHSTGQERYNRGVEDGLALIKSIKSGDVKLKAGETIKLVGHSHGGWHAIGMADYLSSQGYDVEVTYTKNPHQPDADVNRLANHGDYRLVQYSTPSDHVSSDQSKLQKVVGLKVGDWLVGDSEMKAIPGAEFKELNDASDLYLGGHNVDAQLDDIKNIPLGSEGYVGPQR